MYNGSLGNQGALVGKNMQIHISWKMLLAALIFLIGAVLLLRVGTSLLRPPPQLAVPEVTATVTREALAVASTPGSSSATVGAPATPERTAPPTQEPSPTVAPLSPTPESTPELTPEPTLAVPTTTIAPPPTRVPTPVPEQLRIADQSFAQSRGQLSYTFVVSNPNPELLAQTVLYQVAAYDAAGVVLATDTSTLALIGPGQDMGVARNLSLPGGLTVARIEVLLRPAQFVRSAPLPTLMVTNSAFIPGSPSNLTGLVVNNLDRDLIDVTVVGIAYDEGGIIGGGTTVVPFITAQGQAAVSIPVETTLTATRVVFWVDLSALPATR